MTRSRTFYEVAAGIGAIGALVVGVLTLANGQLILAAIAFTALGALVIGGIAFFARFRPRTITRTIDVEVGSYQVVSIDARRGAIVRAEIEADDLVDAWLLDDAGFSRFDRDLRFEPLDSAQSMSSGTLEARAPSRGTLHVVIEPVEDDDDEEGDAIEAKIIVTISK